MMLKLLLMLLPQAGTGGGGGTPAPTLSALTITPFAGVCSGHTLQRNAAVTLNWTSTNFDPLVHQYRIYQDNVLIATYDVATSTYRKEIVGVIQDGCGASWESNWAFRVDIVRRSSGIVLASKSINWVWFYGTCC